MNKLHSSVKEMVLISFLAAIVFVQEEALTFLPNVQLTVFLFVLYAKCLGLKRTSFIITIHVLLDNLVMGSMNPFMLVFMWMGWMWIPLLLCTVFKNVQSAFHLALLGILFSLLYSWTFVLYSCFIWNMKFSTYIMADILFEIILSFSSFLSILWLYDTCKKIFDRYLVV